MREGTLSNWSVPSIFLFLHLSAHSRDTKGGTQTLELLIRAQDVVQATLNPWAELVMVYPKF